MTRWVIEPLFVLDAARKNGSNRTETHERQWLFQFEVSGLVLYLNTGCTKTKSMRAEGLVFWCHRSKFKKHASDDVREVISLLPTSILYSLVIKDSSICMLEKGATWYPPSVYVYSGLWYNRCILVRIMNTTRYGSRLNGGAFSTEIRINYKGGGYSRSVSHLATLFFSFFFFCMD